MLCGIPEDQRPSVLLATAIMPPAGPNWKVTVAIHLVNNHYVVSYHDGFHPFIDIYDSVYDDECVQRILPQLKCLYEEVTEKYRIRHYTVQQREGSTTASGLLAVAHATMLMNRKYPNCRTLDEDLLRCHMVRCLQNERVTLFPAWWPVIQKIKN